MILPLSGARGSLLCLLLAATALGGCGAFAQNVSLDGDWRFAIDPADKIGVADLNGLSGGRTAHVPGSWQTQFADLRDYAGVAWYWRTFTAPALSPGRAMFIHFGAVDYRAEVYVNGQKAAMHDGGYLPFDVDATSLLHAGENQLAVRVVDPGAKPDEVEGIRYAEIPHGKQNWYVETSGPWQSIELDVRPQTRIATLHIRAGADGHFAIDVQILNPPGATAAAASSGAADSSLPYIGAEILDSGGSSVWKQSVNLASGQAQANFSGSVTHPQLWSPAAPNLYTVKAWLYSGDSVSSKFGFRTFEARGGIFYLNGQPIYLRGALDQDFYPDTAYTPPSFDYIRHEMDQAKALGLNLLRCHIKVPDPRYLEAADAAGVLVWYEIPNWDKLTPDSERRGEETLAGMIARDWNHPAIIAVSLINESWGVNLKQADDRQWLKNFAIAARKQVPGWLVEDNSACCDNFHLSTDIADFHDYDSIPDAAGDFDHFVSDLATRPSWLWSPNDDAAVNTNAPLMLSEFGNWGLPHPPDPVPWWFDRVFHGEELTEPAGFLDRYTQYAYGTLFPDLRVLTDATQEHEYQSLKYEIESLRSHPQIQGYVITEFTDINWESNGLLDLWRNVKSFGAKLGALQGDDLIIATLPQRNFRSGQRVHAVLSFAHYDGQPLSGAMVHWGLEGFEQNFVVPLPATTPDNLMPAGSIDFTVPSVTAPVSRKLTFSVEQGGRTLSENSLQLFFYPPRPDELRPAVIFDDPAGRLRRLAEALRSRGYLEPSGQEALPVLITSTLNTRAKAALLAGGRVVLIASDHQEVAPGIEIVPRSGSNLDGNWISNFFWVRKNHPVFGSIGFEPLPGFEAQAINPPAVIRGLPPSAFPSVLAGMFYGWIRNNSGVLLEARAGKGLLLVTTFGFTNSYGSDPYATILLDNLMQYAVSNFQPKFEIPLGM
jgi:Glycosyl hydrolases family 2, sugar binding domain/Glycosyl hydrolases family 2